MSICQRRNGAYLVKYKDAVSGQWKQRQFRSLADAEDFDAAAKVALEKDNPLSLREAVTAYVQSHPLSEKRIEMYSFLVNGYDRKNGSHTQGPAEHLADRYAESLNRQDLESVRQRLFARGLKITSLNLQTGMLKAVLSWAASEDLIAVNPWTKYKSLPGGKTKHRTGTLEQLSRVYAQLPEWGRWAVRTAIALCLRPGEKELFSLEWSAFDWRTKLVNVYMPKTKRTKTVFPPGWYWEEARTRFEADAAAGQTLVCRTGRGRPVTGMNFMTVWKKARRRAGETIPFYAVRHISASEMLARGIDLATVAAQLGHKDITTTAAFYTHALTHSQRAASAALPDVTKFGD